MTLKETIKETVLASPFTSTDDDIDPTTEKGKEVLSQPAATRWELWGYYLYYNGVNIYFSRIKSPFIK